MNVPFAADGTHFGPHLRRNGVYRVGDRKDEKKFTDFGEALVYLKAQHTARWRRPNPNGNWGIVSAVRWADHLV